MRSASSCGPSHKSVNSRFRSDVNITMENDNATGPTDGDSTVHSDTTENTTQPVAGAAYSDVTGEQSSSKEGEPSFNILGWSN